MAWRSRCCARPTAGSSSSGSPGRPLTTPTATTTMAILSLLADGSLSVNPIEDFNRLTTYPFMVNALEAGTIVAVLAGIAGWFMVLRRETFAGHTLSLMAFPGATGAVLIGLPAAAGYFTFCGASALVIGASAGPAAPRPPGEGAAGARARPAVRAAGGCPLS